MKGRIFSLAFAVGFVALFILSSALTYFWVKNRNEAATPKPEAAEPLYLSTPKAVFLLVFTGGDEPGPFSLVALDGEAGRIPVFSFSGDTIFSEQSERVTAGELFRRLSAEGFTGAVEKELSVEIAGYFFWDGESAERILAKTGTFDYHLQKPLRYKKDDRTVDLAAGTQNMTAKKLVDVITAPIFSETERSDLTSRLLAAFFERRLRRFLPQSGDLYETLTGSTETDVSVLDKGRYQDIFEVLAKKKSPVASHVTCDTEKEEESGQLWFSSQSRDRVKKYFR